MNRDGSFLLVGYDDGTILNFQATNWNEPHRLAKGGDHGPVHALALSPDERSFAVASPAAVTRARDEPLGQDLSEDLVTLRRFSGEAVRKLPRMSGTIIALAFSADGSRIGAVDHNYVVKVWRVSDGAEVVSSEVHKASGRIPSSPAIRASFSANLDRAVVLNDADVKFEDAAWDHVVRVWDSALDKPRIFSSRFGSVYSSTLISRDGSRVIVANDYHTLDIRDFVSGRQSYFSLGINIPANAPREVRLSTYLSASPDNRWLVHGSRAGFIDVIDFDRRDGRVAQTFKGPRGNVRASAFRPGGMRLVSGGWEALVRVCRSLKLIMERGQHMQVSFLTDRF